MRTFKESVHPVSGYLIYECIIVYYGLPIVQVTDYLTTLQML